MQNTYICLDHFQFPVTHSPEVKDEIINLEVKKQTTTDGPRGPGGSSRVQGGR
jgi:hypothetical protein